MSTIQHKRGAAFDYSGTISSVGATSVETLSGWSIRAQARTFNGDLTCEFEASIIDPATRKIRLRCADTSGWKPGGHRVDIKLTSPSGDAVYTPTFGIDVQQGVTQ